MPTANNNNKEINQTGVFATFAASIKSIPGIFTAPTMPTLNSEIIKPIKALAPTMIRMTPTNLANTVKKNMMTSPMVSKNVFELDFIFFPLFFAAPETDSDTFLATSPTVSETLSNPSLIFFSMLLMFTGSPVMVNLSAVVFASGTKTQNRMYIKINVPPEPKQSNIHSKRTQTASMPK